MDLWVFAGVLVLGQFSPGPDMLLVTRTALRSGMRDGLRVACGIGCGLALHASVAVSGMVVVLQRFEPVRLALQWLAAGYLLWIACSLLRERFGRGRSVDENVQIAAPATQSPFLRGLMCNLLNPKVALFLAAACAPFLRTSATLERAVAVWLIIVALGAGLWCVWVWLLQWPPVQRAYLLAAGWIDACFALFLGVLALRLIRG